MQLKDDDDLEEVNVIFFALSKLLCMKVADECHFCHHTFSTFHWRERDSAPPQATGTLASAAFNLPTNRAAVACLTRVKRVFSSGDMEWGIGVSRFPSYLIFKTANRIRTCERCHLRFFFMATAHRNDNGTLAQERTSA